MHRVGIASLTTELYGSVWLVIGIHLLDIRTARTWYTTVLLLSSVLMSTSVSCIMRGRESMSNTAGWERRKRLFIWINSVQWFGIVITVVLFNCIHHVALIPWIISVIVGLHFIPLGYIFRSSSYHFIGASIIVADLLVLGCSSPFRYSLSALGTGVVLMAGALWWLLSLVGQTQY